MKHDLQHKTFLFRSAVFSALTGAVLFTGCRSNHAQTVAAGQDPADANMAQPYTGGTAGQAQVMGQTESYAPTATGRSYETQAPAPIIRKSPTFGEGQQQADTYYPVPQSRQTNGVHYQQPAQNYGQQGYAQPEDQGNYPQQGYADPNGYPQQQGYDGSYEGYSQAEQDGEQALAESDTPPPPLPEYDQPPAPEDDYLWTPGYWDYASTGYFWVPGAWVAPPFVGALWTPPYWAYTGGHYLCHRGYWGPHVGYYGGINYGFGYIGIGYFGGYWHGRDFFYNRAVTNVNVVNIHNTYIRNVVYNNTTYGPHSFNRVSYNGGRGGLNVQPRPQESAAMREAHYAPQPVQRENRVIAQGNRAQFFSANRGRPQEFARTQAFGNVRDIPTAPREQAFNHAALANRSFGNGNPGAFNRSNQPGQPNQPNGFNRGNNQPGQPNQPGGFNRGDNQPGQPGGDTRFGGYNRGNNQPATQPGASSATQPNAANDRFGGTNRPAQPDSNARFGGTTNDNRFRRDDTTRGRFGNDPRGAQPVQPGTGSPAARPTAPATPTAPNNMVRPGQTDRSEMYPGGNNRGQFNRGNDFGRFNNGQPSQGNVQPSQPNGNRPEFNRDNGAGRPQGNGYGFGRQQQPDFQRQQPMQQPQQQPNFQHQQPMQQQPSFQRQQPMQQPQQRAERPGMNAPQSNAPRPAPAAVPHAEAPRGGNNNPNHH